MISKALDMSTAITIVLFGGCFLLNPSAIVWVICCNAVDVECNFLYPCWYAFSGRKGFILSNKTRSRVFATFDSREIGRYDFPSFGSLFGFRIGIILAVFQDCGMMLVLSDIVNSFVNILIA